MYKIHLKPLVSYLNQNKSAAKGLDKLLTIIQDTKPARVDERDLLLNFDYLNTHARLSGIEDWIPRLLMGRQECIFPLFQESKGKFLILDKAIEPLRFYCISLARAGTEKEIAGIAANVWEQLVLKVMKSKDYTTSIGQVSLQGVHVVKGDIEIDGLCWDHHEVIVISAKYEMEIPGSWRPEAIKNREQNHEKWDCRLTEMVNATNDRLNEKYPTFWHQASKQSVSLPSNLLKTREIRGVIVSGRIEPRTAYSQRILSMMPPLAHGILKQELMGSEQIAPIWSTDQPLP
jgi:hypothetical protein